MNMNELIELRREGRTAILTFRNGPVNVCSKEVVRQLGQSLTELEKDDSVGVLILTGAGRKAFVAGADISGFPDIVARGETGIREYLMEDHQVFNQLANFPKPTIAAINGLALGGGLELTLMCDIRIAEAHARFSLPEITLGMFPGYGGTQRLARLIGAARCKELIFTGRMFDADEAMALGLLSKIVPEGEGLVAAMELAERISDKSAPVLAMAKQAVDGGLELPLEEGIAYEAGLLAKAFLTEDNAEGVAAFMGKRKPVFRHR